MQTFSLMVAPNGARRGKADHPALPITPAELAATARACQAEGADAIHLHVRDAAGRHSLDPARYREAMAAIQATAPGMRVQITTESAGSHDVAVQYACLRDLRPAWASASVRELARDPALAARIYAMARDSGIRLQHILYGPDCIALFNDLRTRRVIRDETPEVILVLGRYAPPRPARPSDLDPLLAALEHPVNWTACAFGPAERACLLRAVRLGGNARIGFENNTCAPDGTPLPDNAASVRAFVTTARAEGLTPLARVSRQSA